ncbi:transmembrane protein 220-like isoform X8 [Tachypleus tridentatus]
MIWRCVNLFMSLFFFFATCAQVNDPDPLLWMVVYVVPSVLSLLLAIHPFLTGNFMWRLACFLHFITSFGFFLYLLVQFARVMDPQFYGINPVNYEKENYVVCLLSWFG